MEYAELGSANREAFLPLLSGSKALARLRVRRFKWLSRSDLSGQLIQLVGTGKALVSSGPFFYTLQPQLNCNMVPEGTQFVNFLAHNA